MAVIMLQIVAIDLLLGGDNAVVIAMACRKLPPQKRTNSTPETAATTAATVRAWLLICGTTMAIK
ncbi:TerC family protein, partial [Klebsiella pneumoniae]|uniref:TerC family protein n=1 Tax=Klebsiella pneumoniae TaxID=573 RepID=UPI003F7B03B8